jgi:hypothetical protein
MRLETLLRDYAATHARGDLHTLDLGAARDFVNARLDDAVSLEDVARARDLLLTEIAESTRALRHQLNAKTRADLGGTKLASSPAFLGATRGVAGADGPVTVEANRTYHATTRWRGESVRVSVSVDPQMAAFLRERGHRLDVANLTLVTKDGVCKPVLGGGESPWAARLGQVEKLSDAPPGWQDRPVLCTEVRISARTPQPDGSMNYSVFASEFRGDIVAFAARAQHDRPELEGSAAIAAALQRLPTPESAMARRGLAEGLEVSGVSESSIERAMPAIRQVLGKSLATHAARRRDSDLRVRACVAAIDARLQAGQAIPDALSLEYARLLQQTFPTEIVVVPEGKHFAAMPQWYLHRGDDEPAVVESRGVNVNVALDSATGRYKRFVFIPEDDPGTQVHELLHLLEQTVLSDAQLAVVDAAYTAAVRDGGPFARPYGVSRSEFLTTWGELHAGFGGPSGRVFSDRRAGAVGQVLRDTTDL